MAMLALIMIRRLLAAAVPAVNSWGAFVSTKQLLTPPPPRVLLLAWQAP